MYHHTALARQINIEGTYDFIDSTRYRLTRPLTKSELSFLRQHADKATVGLATHYLHGFTWDLLEVVIPDERALYFLDELPVMMNYAEIARNHICSDPELMHDLFIGCFLHRWHGRHEFVIRDHGTTTYTGQHRAGRWFVWYSDKHCKLTGQTDCFHLEARYQGVQALRKLGINRPSDLLGIDHVAFWRKNLQLRTVDPERFGRCVRNRRAGSRCHLPLIDRSGPINYNRDGATGGAVSRYLSMDCTHPEYLCVQHLVDQIGTGPFLIPVNINDYVRQSEMFSDTPLSQRFPHPFYPSERGSHVAPMH